MIMVCPFCSVKFDKSSPLRAGTFCRKEHREAQNTKTVREHYRRRRAEKKKYSDPKLLEETGNRFLEGITEALKTGIVPRDFCHKLGCPIDTLEDHVKAQWRGEMNGFNFGKVWRLGFYTPMSRVDPKVDGAISRAFNYTNIRVVRILGGSSNFRPRSSHEAMLKFLETSPPAETVNDSEDEAVSYTKDYYAKNKERILARTRAWIAANPEKVREYARKKKAAKRAARKMRTKMQD